MTRVAFHQRTMATAPVLVAAIGCLLGGGALVAFEVSGLGWILLLVGAGLALLGTSQDKRPKEALILDDHGVTDAVMGYGTIPWDQIVRAEARQLGRFWIVGLDVTNPEAWLARTPPARLALRRLDEDHTLPPVLLAVHRLDQSADEIARLINARVRGS